LATVILVELMQEELLGVLIGDISATARWFPIKREGD